MGLYKDLQGCVGVHSFKVPYMVIMVCQGLERVADNRGTTSLFLLCTFLRRLLKEVVLGLFYGDLITSGKVFGDILHTL